MQKTIEQGIIYYVVAYCTENSLFDKAARPGIVMTDDISTECSAFQEAQPNADLLLCNFHFLQSKQTRLHDGKNDIEQHDRVILTQKVKNMVYVQTE